MKCLIFMVYWKKECIFTEQTLLIKIGTISFNTLQLTRKKFFFIPVSFNVVVLEKTNSLNAFGFLKHFSFRKLLRCVKKLKSVGKMSGEYGGCLRQPNIRIFKGTVPPPFKNLSHNKQILIEDHTFVILSPNFPISWNFAF